MSDWQVTCTKHEGSVESIELVGAEFGVWPVIRVIQAIENGNHRFYTLEGHTKACVRVVEGVTGKYLRTSSEDGGSRDRLLVLPECRVQK